MRSKPIIYCGILLAVVSIAFVAQRTSAQSSAARSLITQPVDDTKLLQLKGNTYPLARAKYDQGPAPASLPEDRMLLVLKRSPAQQAAVDALIAQQADKKSPNYRKWLTPEQFGERFGISDADLQKVTNWLQSHGFASIKPAVGRNVIEFSGNAGQVQAAFHTTIHSYIVDGRQHWANSTDPYIPQALAPVVAGIASLHNFPKHPMHHFAGNFRKSPDTGKIESIKPQYTFVNGSDTYYALAPYDFATIYNVTPLWNASPAITGQGQKIAIVSDSNINLSDVSQFRALFGLPANVPNVIVNGTDPGVQPCASNGDECEAVIDVEWSGSVAKNASINLVVTQSTSATNGIDASAQYIVDNSVAPVLSESYGACELELGTTENAYLNNLWSQAATNGITVVVSTGDDGSAGCDVDDPNNTTTAQPAQGGLAVSGVATTPYNVAVGGTDFNQLVNNPASYWGSSNASGTENSALGYIPETTWNDSCTNEVFVTFGNDSSPEATCNDSSLIQYIAPVGGSGGVSSCTTSVAGNMSTCAGGYAKPSWQIGTGVPADGKRDVPDLSLFAGDGFSGSFYLVCEADIDNNTPCSLANFAGFGGTSVSAQVFAGIVALINQQTQSSQGNLNLVLYPLAAGQSPSNCNSSSPASSCIFNDVTIGTNAQPCAKGSADCTTTNSGDANGILNGYNAGVGYDTATGLGSVNAANLVAAFATGFTVTSASPTVSVSSPGSSGTFTATVTAQNGFTGTVTFTCANLPTGATCSFAPATATLTSTTTSATTTVTVTTTAPSSVVPASRPSAPSGLNIPLIVTLLCIFSAAIIALKSQSGRRLRSGAAFALLVLGLAGLMAMTSCGGGGSGGGSGGGGGGGGGTGGTPTGSTTAAVVATSGSASTSLSFTLDVQ